MSGFGGFPKDTIGFLADLSENNNREWFADNRDRYEANFLEPAMAFIRAMEKPLERVAPALSADAKKSGGSLMRIYKDTRFSKDKTPYKTNIGIQFRHRAGKDIHAPGIYLHISPEECFVGAGMWRPDSTTLKKIREQVVEQEKRWRSTVNRKTFAEAFSLYDDRLKSAPRGFDKEHTAIEYLRLKSFIGIAELKRKEIENSNLVDHITKLVKKSAPVMAFLCEAVGQPY